MNPDYQKYREEINKEAFFIHWIRLQNWVATKKLDYRTEWELRCHEMDSHEMAEKQGYSQALSEIHDEMCRLMNDWPDLNAHRNYRKGLGQLDD
jgi:hypothetical protein